MISIDDLFEEDFKPQWLVAQEKYRNRYKDSLLVYAFTLRYQEIENCLNCHKPNKYYIVRGRKTLACAWCGKHVAPLGGTVLHKSATLIRTWIEVAKLLRANPRLPALHIQRDFGMTYKTAWRLKKLILQDFADRGILWGFISHSPRINEDLIIKYRFGYHRR